MSTTTIRHGRRNATRRGAPKTRGPVLKRLAAALAAACGATPAAHAAANLILPTGQTATTLHSAAGVTTITTSTIRGSNAFNSFSQFREAQGQIVNLVVPDAAGHLINLVSGGAVQIDGVLNAIHHGHIGGNVVFADPQGMVVGASGVVNVGSLVVSTPTRAFLQRMLSGGRIDDSAVAQLLAGDAPLSAAGHIDIAGRIHALRGISLQAAGVLEAAGARMSAGDAARLHMALFRASVNTQGLQVASLRSSAGGIAVTTVGDLLLGQLQSGLQQGDAFALYAGGNMLADGSSGVQLTAGSSAAQAVLDAGGSIGASAQPLQLLLPEFSASAGGDIYLHDLESAQVPTLDAAGDAALQVDGTLVFGQAQAGGSLRLTAAGDLDGTSAQASQATLSASQGSLQLGTLTAQQAQLAALDDIGLAQAWIAHAIDLFANGSIQATVDQRGADTPLSVGLAGQPTSGVVHQVALNLDAPNGVNFDPFRVYGADLTVQSPDISILDGYVVGSLRLDTPDVSLLMDNLDPRLQSVDVQLYQPGQDFFLMQQGRSSYTSAFVEHYFHPYQVTVPNFTPSHTLAYPDFQGSSADSYASDATLPRNGLVIALPQPAPIPTGPMHLFEGLGGGQVNTSADSGQGGHGKRRHG